MSYAYGTHLKEIKDNLITVIKTTTTFATHTYADYIKKITTYPTCFIRLRKDNFDDIGPYETQHVTTLIVQIVHKATYTEATLDSIIGYVGEIVDAIEANRTLSSNRVLRTEVTEIDFSMRDDEHALFHYAYLTIMVESLRNV